MTQFFTLTSIAIGLSAALASIFVLSSLRRIGPLTARRVIAVAIFGATYPFVAGFGFVFADAGFSIIGGVPVMYTGVTFGPLLVALALVTFYVAGALALLTRSLRVVIFTLAAGPTAGLFLLAGFMRDLEVSVANLPIIAASIVVWHIVIAAAVDTWAQNEARTVNDAQEDANEKSQSAADSDDSDT